MTAKLSPSEAVIELTDVRFRYPSGSDVLNIRDLRIRAGEKVFLYGPSGSGKTTLLGILAGVLQPSGGSVRVLGKELAGLSAKERDRFRGEHLGYVFQMFNLLPYLSVLENILISCDLSPARRSKISGDYRERAAEIARHLGIENLLRRNVTDLSVGQQQRVAVARALLGSPEIVIADEPTSALDAEHREKFLDLLFRESERSGSTVVFVSHDRQLEKMFDRGVSLPEINRR